MGIQISGLLSNSAFDWKSIVDQLIEAENIPVKKLETEKTANDDKITALSDVRTALESLQDSLQAIRANSPFYERTVTSNSASSTWIATSSSSAPIGSYTIDVQQLATATKAQGGLDIGKPLSTSSDVSGVTLASMNTALTITKQTSVFTVNGKQVEITPDDSLDAVFTKISTATSGDVTGSYDPVADKISLTSGSGTLVLGASNDTSNFFRVFGLANNNTGTVTSSSALGVVKVNSTLTSSGLATLPTAVDGDGNGTFKINGVEIAYNKNTDSLAGIMARINASTAGVTASYDVTKDRMVLTNKSTGDMGLSWEESAGGLLAALKVTTGVTTRGDNALFTINGAPEVLTSSSNTLDESVTGIKGLSVVVNSEESQTLSIHADTGTMQTAIEDFITKFNAVQDIIEEKTKVTRSGGQTTTSILSSNREVQEWGRKLQSLAFAAVTDVAGSVKSLDDLGIDFDGITGHLAIKNTGKLSNALTNKPDDVQAYFSANGKGLVPTLYESLTTMMTSDTKQQETIRLSSKSIDEQITTLQGRIQRQRETLTQAFIRMLNAQSEADSQNKAITNAFFKNKE